MLIHLTPRMFACRHTEHCTLIDWASVELSLTLKGDKDLIARRPYSNKNYLVACRKVGLKAMNGILIETPQPVREFTAVTRWAIAANHIATHRVRYIVLDNEYDALSENMILWYGMSEYLGGWKSRWPELPEGSTPANTQPRMEVAPQAKKRGEVIDVIDAHGLLIERTELFRLHTIERDRLLNIKESVVERIPAIEAAFRGGLS